MYLWGNILSPATPYLCQLLMPGCGGVGVSGWMASTGTWWKAGNGQALWPLPVRDPPSQPSLRLDPASED